MSSFSHSLIQRLKTLQRKVIRVITKSSSNSHTRPLFVEHNLLNISQIKFIQTSEFMYKYNNSLLPSAFSSYFSPILHLSLTRSNSEYRCIYARTNTRKFSIRFQGPVIWNKLPVNIRAATSYVSFKHLIRTHTKQNVL